MAAYLSLIRLHSKGGNVEEATRLIQEIREKGLDIKFRLFYPILEALKEKGDVSAAADLIVQSVLYTDHAFRANHVSLLIETAAKSGRLSDAKACATVENFLLMVSKELTGLPYNSLEEIHCSVSGKSLEEVRGQGIYIESAESLEREMDKNLLIVEDERKKGFVVAEDSQLQLDAVSAPLASVNGITCKTGKYQS